MIKVSLGTWAFSFGAFGADPWPLDKVLTYARDAGYDGVELNGFRPHVHYDDYNTKAKRIELKKKIKGHHLGISAYSPDFRSVPPAKCRREDYLREFQKALKICEDCEIGIIRVDTVSPPDEKSVSEYESAFTTLVGNWRSAAQMAAKSNVVMVWEFEPGFWLNKPGEVKKVLRSVNDANFKALFDSSHAYMGAVIGARQTGKKELLAGGVLEYAQLLGGDIGHIHLIDSDGTLHDSETSTHTPFGRGKVDFGSLAGVLKKHGLEWWCADYCFCREAESEARTGAAFIRNLVR